MTLGRYPWEGSAGAVGSHFALSMPLAPSLLLSPSREVSPTVSWALGETESTKDICGAFPRFQSFFTCMMSVFPKVW